MRGFSSRSLLSVGVRAPTGFVTSNHLMNNARNTLTVGVAASIKLVISKLTLITKAKKSVARFLFRFASPSPLTLLLDEYALFIRNSGIPEL